MAAPPQATRLDVPDDVEAINDLFYERGWSDGLPIVPPTEERVARMLATTRLPPPTVLGVMPPREGTVTVEKVAVNAVMAGCKPEHFPVVLAAVRASLQEQFNVGGVSVTTGGAAPVVIVSGPVAERVGINSGTACFGAGFRANAAIGRALRLVMRNLGGAVPGEFEKSTQAQPGKFTFCFAENEARSPWEPLRVTLGYRPEESTVTLVGIRGLYTLSEQTASSGVEVLRTIALGMATVGVISFYTQARRPTVVVALGPEHAQEVAAAGFAKEDVRRFLFEHARLPKGTLRDRCYWGNRTWPAWLEAADDATPVPPTFCPEDILVVVAGGDGRHSSWLQPWSTTQVATEVVEE